MYSPFQTYQQPIQQPQQQIQNGGFMLIPNENVAYNYPVAPGNCVTFKVEGKPIIIEKSMGFSQFDSPRLEIYDLVKREMKPQTEEVAENNLDGLKDEINSIWNEINALKNGRKPNSTKRKEVVENDAD